MMTDDVVHLAGVDAADETEKKENAMDTTGIDQTKSMTREPPTPYLDWVLQVRKVQSEGKNIVLSLYHLLSKGEAEQIWKLGEWQSFERCLEKEFGISPQRWAHLVECVARFGEEKIGRYGLDPLITMLRLPQASSQERAVLHEIEEIETSLGRPPGELVISRLVTKYVPPQRPVNSGVTEADRLRAEVRRLQGELKETKAKLRMIEQENARLRRKVKAAKK